MGRSCCDKIARTNFILVSLSHDDVAHQALRGDSLEELFKQMDSNNDGVLEQIELEGAIRHLGLDHDMYLKQLQDKMTERHGKRVIKLPQLKEATRRVSSLKKAEAAAMLFDQSVSGTCMTLSELQSLEQEYQRMSSGDAKECRFSFRSSNAKSIMEWADKDGDGMLSRQEFIVAVLGKNALSLRQSAMPAMLAVMADTSSTSAADGNGTQVPLGVADSLGAVEPANAAL